MSGIGRAARAAARRILPEVAYRWAAAPYKAARAVLEDASWRLSPSGRGSRRRLAQLRGAFAGRRGFVIGNGPSLKETDLTLLRDEVTVGSNGLFLLFDAMGFLPTVYTVEDHLVAEDRARWIADVRGTVKLFPWDLVGTLGADPDTVFVDFRRRYPGFPRFSDDLQRRAYWGGTVTFLNLQVAWHLGCREVYLVGVDHSYVVPAYAQGNVITSREDDPNHFHPDYFGKGFRWHDPVVERMEASYRVAKAAYERRGGAIRNATKGGKLEVFERVDYDALLRRRGSA